MPPMRVDTVDFVDGARRAEGIAIVIDVFRAFSVAPYASQRGATLLPVAGLDEARALRARHPDWILCGERDARPPADFDFGNSPHDLARANLAGRVVVHTTHAGTQGLAACVNADEVLTGSLVNAAALVRYVKNRRPAVVTLVRMGWQARERSLEDDTCARLLEARLRGEPIAEATLVAALRFAPAAAKFHDPVADYAPYEDLELCLALDRFDFVLRRRPADADGLCFLERLAV